MKKLFYYISALLLTAIGYSCENNSNVGNSLNDSQIMVIADSSYMITGVSLPIPSVKARTSTQLLGALNAENFGTFSSDVVTEMMPVSTITTEGVTEETIDKVRLVMFARAESGFTGDSIAPMQMSVYKLKKNLPNPIYSDFDPSEYYNESDLLGTATYTASDMDKTSTERAAHVSSYTSNGTTTSYELREARVDLPLEIGRSVLREYKNNPEIFSSPDEFSKFFPGFYIKNTYGSGRVTNFYTGEVEVLYHRRYKTDFNTDTIVTDSVGYMAATPEVIVNNIIKMDVDSKLKQAVADGEALLVAPQGYEVDIKLPIRQIVNDLINKYDLTGNSLNIVNELLLEIPVDTIANDYGIKPPTSIMLIRTSEKDDFFNENKLTDGCRSYVATYDSSNKVYQFGGLREYILDLMESDDEVTDNDEALSIIPVDLTSESVSSTYSYYYSASSVLSKVAPAVSTPSMVRLKLDKAKLRFTFTKKK